MPRGRHLKGKWHPTDEIWSELPVDGSQVSLLDLRKALRRKGMSPWTLYKYLPRLEQARRIERVTDTSTRPARVYYRRVVSASTSAKRVTFQEWFDHRFRPTRAAVIIALRHIGKHYELELEDLPSLSNSNFSGGIGNVFDIFVERWPWIIIKDFHRMLRSGRFIDEIGDDVKLRNEVAKAERELEKLFRTVRESGSKAERKEHEKN